MVTDKICFKVPGQLVKPEVVEQLRKRAPVHFLRFNSADYKLVVHMDWRPDVAHIGVRTFWAVVEMVKAGAFEPKFSAVVKVLSQVWNHDSSVIALRATRFLRFYFTLREWELAMDFFGAPLVQYFDPLDFIHKGNTHYTRRSYKKKHRIVDGKEKLKSVQRSPLKVYPWHRKHGGGDYCDRLEFRYQGKFRKLLTWELLDGTVEDSYFRLLPSMAKIMKTETDPMRFEFYGYWILGSPWWFRGLLEAAGWLQKSPILRVRKATEKEKRGVIK